MRSTFNTISPKTTIDEFCLEIHVTEMCNYSCSYCNLSPMNKHTTIDYDNMFSLSLPKHTRVFLLGGEPTIDKYFFNIIEECYSRGYTNIDVQTNLTFNTSNMIKRLTDNNTPVKFYGSYHMEHSDFKKFTNKCIDIKDAGMYGGVHLMWLSRLNAKCINYYNLLSSTLTNISLEPTLPKSLQSADWDDKVELKRFIEYGHLPKCDRLRKEIYVDNEVTTIGLALSNNVERGIIGKRCYAPSNTVVYSVNKNKFYNCTFDLLYDREFSYDSISKGFCMCKNKICCADLEFKKD